MPRREGLQVAAAGMRRVPCPEGFGGGHSVAAPPWLPPSERLCYAGRWRYTVLHVCVVSALPPFGLGARQTHGQVWQLFGGGLLKCWDISLRSPACIGCISCNHWSCPSGLALRQDMWATCGCRRVEVVASLVYWELERVLGRL